MPSVLIGVLSSFLLHRLHYDPRSVAGPKVLSRWPLRLRVGTFFCVTHFNRQAYTHIRTRVRMFFCPSIAFSLAFFSLDLSNTHKQLATCQDVKTS